MSQFNNTCLYDVLYQCFSIAAIITNPKYTMWGDGKPYRVEKFNWISRNGNKCVLSYGKLDEDIIKTVINIISDTIEEAEVKFPPKMKHSVISYNVKSVSNVIDKFKEVLNEIYQSSSDIRYETVNEYENDPQKEQKYLYALKVIFRVIQTILLIHKLNNEGIRNRRKKTGPSAKYAKLVKQIEMMGNEFEDTYILFKMVI